MDAIEYFKQKKRMTKIDQGGHCGIDCSDCPLNHGSNGTNYYCHQFERLQPENAIEIIENWAKEHPPKTYAQDFFERFPNAPKNIDGTPIACKKSIYGGRCITKCPGCWNALMEE